MSKTSWIKEETKTWVSAGIINSDQAEQIVSLYPEDQGNRLITALLVLGAILLGAGVILFFAANWQYMPAWVKVAIVLTALGSFHLTSHLTHDKYPKLSVTLSLLACIMFGAGIWLIAQIFHINTHFPNGMLLWLLGTLPAAYLLKENLLLALSSLLLVAWIIAETSLSLSVVAGTVMLFAVVVYLIYQRELSLALVAALTGALVFITKEMYLLIDEVSGPGYYHLDVFLAPFCLLLISPLLIYIAGFPFNRISIFPQVFRFTGTATTAVSLFALAMFFTHAPQLPPGAGFFVPKAGPVIWTYYVFFTAMGLYLLLKQQKDIKTILQDNYIWPSIYILLLTVMLVSYNNPLLVIAVHLFMFVWALALIITGYRKQDGLYFTVGLVAFNLYTVFEYFNLGWNALPKSIFFIIGGLVLILGGSFMEHQRRKVIKSWQERQGA